MTRCLAVLLIAASLGWADRLRPARRITAGTALDRLPDMSSASQDVQTRVRSGAMLTRTIADPASSPGALADAWRWESCSWRPS
jgi:hypothetical protein